MPQKKTSAKTKKNGAAARNKSVKTSPNRDAIKAVRVRMYRQGLGDCFLLSFGVDFDLKNAAHVLIDCGTLGATTTGVSIKDVAADIAETTNHRIQAVVGTHEHSDHLSGFNSANETFDAIKFENTWLAWTEKAGDDLAEQIKKYKNDLGLAAFAGHQALVASGDPRANELAEKTRNVLSFVAGEAPLGATFAKSVDAAMKYLADHPSHPKVKYLEPGTSFTPTFLPGVRVYVLAPPRDEKKIKNMGEHGDPELYELSAASVNGFRCRAEDFKDELKAAAAGEDATGIEDPMSPFEERYRVRLSKEDKNQAFYNNSVESWRKIDTDWLSVSSDLALQLDNYTNNTSLVLAFELGDEGPVILMAADAQLGSWLSWHDYTWKIQGADGKTRNVTAKDLLKRTVIYKVGHHSSHNATAKAHGLELMESDDLLCLIPLDERVAKNKKWPMPAKKLYEQLMQAANGRVIRSDIGGKLPAGESVTKASEEDLYFDVVLTNG